MKKVILVFGLGLFLLASCKKDYTCTCTEYLDGIAYAEESITIHDTKSKATETCDKDDYAVDANGLSTSCEIK